LHNKQSATTLQCACVAHVARNDMRRSCCATVCGAHVHEMFHRVCTQFFVARLCLSLCCLTLTDLPASCVLSISNLCVSLHVQSCVHATCYQCVSTGFPCHFTHSLLSYHASPTTPWNKLGLSNALRDFYVCPCLAIVWLTATLHEQSC
jgi:hypothetical protein